MSSPDNEIIKKLVEKAGEMDPNLAHIKPKIQTPSNGKLVLIYEKKVLTEDGIPFKQLIRITADEEGNILSFSGSK